MRRLIAAMTIGASIALFAVTSISASAQSGPPCVPDQQGQGAATCTAHLKDFMLVMPVGQAAPCLPAGTIFWTVNGVFHITLNKLSSAPPDSWLTSTMTGPFTFIPEGSTEVTLTGHGTSWFGSENNNQNNVQHFTYNLEAHSVTGGTFKFHMNADATTTPDGDINFHFDSFVQC
jgi:hypothetical protein